MSLLLAVYLVALIVFALYKFVTWED